MNRRVIREPLLLHRGQKWQRKFEGNKQCRADGGSNRAFAVAAAIASAIIRTLLMASGMCFLGLFFRTAVTTTGGSAFFCAAGLF
jgi:hypothetical protein